MIYLIDLSDGRTLGSYVSVAAALAIAAQLGVTRYRLEDCHGVTV